MSQQDTSANLSQKQQQQVGDIQVQGDDNIFNLVQGHTVTFTQTKIIQISTNEIKTRELILSSPYKGLKNFDPEDASHFFGRDQFLAGLVDELENTNFLLLLGASGSGKSSIIRAGLVPWLQKKWGKHFFNLMFTPDRDPFESLYGSLLSQRYTQAQAQLAQLGEVKTLSQVIKLVKKPESFCLIFIDQFEELFTVSEVARRDRFILSLDHLCKEKIPGLKIVATMRSDFLHYLDLSPANLLANLTQKHRPLITQMQPDELRLAIEQPAAHHGVVFEPGLVEEIIKDIHGQAGYLPLLQYTLDLLWKTEVEDGGIQDRTLNIDSYRKLGGIRGALQQHVDQFHQELTDTQKKALQRIFLKLVNIGGDAASETEWKPVRRRQNLSEFQDLEEKLLLTKLVDQKLLVSDASADVLEGSQVEDKSPTIEIAHEILLTSWTALKGWILENRQSIALRNRLDGDVALWKTKRADSELWSGAKLSRALELRNDPTFQRELGGFSDVANQFIDASIGLRKRQRRRSVIGYSGFPIAVILIVGIVYQLQQLQRQQVVRLAAQSESLLSLAVQPVEATVYALAAIDLGLSSFVQFPHQPRQVAAEGSMLNSLQYPKELNRIPDIRQLTSIASSANGKTIISGSDDGTIQIWNTEIGKMRGSSLKAHSSGIQSVAISANGEVIASGSWDNTVRVWDARTGEAIGRPLEGQLIRPLPPGYSNSVTSVAISADGRTIVSGSSDNTVRLWNTQTGEPIGQPLECHIEGITSVALSADGSTIVSGSWDDTLCVWNAQTRERIGGPLKGHEGDINSVAISTNGQTIVSGARDRTVRVWNAQTGQPIGQPLVGDGSSVNSVSISADGQMIVAGSADGTVHAWDVQSGEAIGKPLRGHTSTVFSVAISADGKTIFSGGNDDTVRIWSTRTAHPISQVKAYTDTINSIAISKDGKTVVTGSNDSTVQIWDAQTGDIIAQPQSLEGHGDLINAVAISADGKTVASGSDDFTIRLWEVQTQQMLGRPLEGHESGIASLVMSEDGSTLFSGSFDKTIRHWNTNTGEAIGQPLKGHDDTVSSLDISSDGKILISGSYDNTIRFWDSQTGEFLRHLQGHTATVSSLDISPDGKILVSGSWDKTVRLWNVQTGEEIGMPLLGHEDRVTSVAFSKDGKTIFSGSDDGTIRLWDSSSRKPIGQALRGHRSWVTSVVPAPDGKTVISGSDDNTLRVWQVSPQAWIEAACKQLKDHSILLNNPTNDDLVKQAQSTCEESVWSEQSGSAVGFSNPLQKPLATPLLSMHNVINLFFRLSTGTQ